MPTTISDGANRITTEGHAFGMFRRKHQCIKALETRQKNRPIGIWLSIIKFNYSKSIFMSKGVNCISKGIKPS